MKQELYINIAFLRRNFFHTKHFKDLEEINLVSFAQCGLALDSRQISLLLQLPKEMMFASKVVHENNIN